MKKILLTFLMLIAAVPLWAEDFEVNAISYNIIDETNKTVEVTFNGESYGAYYSGAVSIPSEVSFNGTSYSVTSIGENAFRTSRDLTSVTIGNSVTLIGRSAFNNCPSLTSVTIPNSVTLIDAYAFLGCTGLTEITIPNSVTTIGNAAFKGCSSLMSVNYNAANCTTMGSSAYPVFGDCTNLKTINIGKEVKTIPGYAFSGCSSLAKLNIEDGTESISGLSFPDSPIDTLYLGRNTSDLFMQGKTSLKELTIGNTVTTIGTDAFSGCSSLTKLNIEDGVESISGLSFPDSPIDTLYLGRNTSDTFMQGKKSLKKLTIGNSVTSIRYYAFYGCSGLTSVTIGNSVTSIGISAFYDCTGLTEVNITDLSAWCKINFNSSYANPLSYAHHLKLNGTEVTNLVIPNDVTEIKPYAFSGCTGLTEVTIPNSVTSIGGAAFSGCTGLTEITIPNSVTSIPNDAFLGCTGLTSITIPNSVTAIGESAFSGCTGLTSVTIPNSVTTV